MNKKDILQKLELLNLPKEEYIVISDASMVVQGIKSKTLDISIAVSSKLYKELIPKSIFLFNNSYCDVYNYEGVELNTNWFNKKDTLVINDIYFQNPFLIKILKNELRTDNDKKDVKKIDLFLDLQDTLKYEKKLYKKGITLIAGVDEVGRGPLIGPVVAAAVILPKNFKIAGLTDSKKLSEKKRNEFDKIIKKEAISYGIGIVSNDIIDNINIYEATKIAMKKAVDNLSIKPEYILVDAMKMDFKIPSLPIIKGDLRSESISAASVIAKVYRDSLMYELDKEYPYYELNRNKGYPTKKHIEAINEYGIIEEHRKSFGPVKDYLSKSR